MFADELRAMFDHYRVAGFPTLPDREALAGPRRGADRWYLSLTPREAARIRRAIDLGGRGSSWAERDNNL